MVRWFQRKNNIQGIRNLIIPSDVDFIIPEAFWNKHGNQFLAEILSVTFPSNVKEIGENAFRLNCYLQKVIFKHTDENELTILGGVFSRCDALKEIKLPRKTSVDSAGSTHPTFGSICEITFDSSGDWCNNLSVLAPSIVKATLTNLEEVTKCDFAANKHLKFIYILYAKIIGAQAFENCPSLIGVFLDNVTKIQEGAFENCKNLKIVVLPKGKFIGDNAFKNCPSLDRIPFPNVTEICEGAFENCIKLEEVELPNVEIIEKGAFKGCTSLQKISLPKVTKICKDAFANCKKT